MITEDYVSYETAKLLKKKGFDEATIGYYYTISEIPEKIKFFDSPISIYDSEGLIGCIQAPTLQMAMKWLREKKGIAIIPVLSSILDNEKFLWDVKIVVAKTGERYSQGWVYENQEDAFDTAIKYCLENLV